MSAEPQPIRGFVPVHSAEPLSWFVVKALVTQGIEDFETSGAKVTSVHSVHFGEAPGDWPGDGSRALIFEGMGIPAEVTNV